MTDADLRAATGPLAGIRTFWLPFPEPVSQETIDCWRLAFDSRPNRFGLIGRPIVMGAKFQVYAANEFCWEPVSLEVTRRGIWGYTDHHTDEQHVTLLKRLCEATGATIEERG